MFAIAGASPIRAGPRTTVLMGLSILLRRWAGRIVGQQKTLVGAAFIRNCRSL
jgi:hypothetical protein